MSYLSMNNGALSLSECEFREQKQENKKNRNIFTYSYTPHLHRASHLRSFHEQFEKFLRLTLIIADF